MERALLTLDNLLPRLARSGLLLLLINRTFYSNVFRSDIFRTFIDIFHRLFAGQCEVETRISAKMLDRSLALGFFL